MKKICFTVLLATSITAAADIEISNPRIEVTAGNGLTAVQPTAFLIFDFASCAKFDLQLTKVRAYGASEIKLGVDSRPDQMDCMGPLTNRRYSLQITSDYRGQKFSVLNPLKPVLR